MLSNKIKQKLIKINFNNKMQLSKQPILFDVSLRDGLQGRKLETITLQEKKDIFHNIMFNYKPDSIEIGSIVNPKIMPIMADSVELYKYASDFIKNVSKTNTDLYIVTPTKKSFFIGLSHNIQNYSFLTSVSESFQKTNVNRTISETKEELTQIFKLIDPCAKYNFYKTKLYISCINECPIEGKLNNDFIIHEILKYHKEFPNINELCLSDTCGTLNFEDFKYIVDACIYFGIPPSKISLHLHVNSENNNINEVKQIINHALHNDLNRFDVSIMESGGCSVTMTASKLSPNMSYELLYSIMNSYNKVD